MDLGQSTVAVWRLSSGAVYAKGRMQPGQHSAVRHVHSVWCGRPMPAPSHDAAGLRAAHCAHMRPAGTPPSLGATGHAERQAKSTTPYGISCQATGRHPCPRRQPWTKGDRASGRPLGCASSDRGPLGQLTSPTHAPAIAMAEPCCASRLARSRVAWIASCGLTDAIDQSLCHGRAAWSLTSCCALLLLVGGGPMSWCVPSPL